MAKLLQSQARRAAIPLLMRHGVKGPERLANRLDVDDAIKGGKIDRAELAIIVAEAVKAQKAATPQKAAMERGAQLARAWAARHAATSVEPRRGSSGLERGAAAARSKFQTQTKTSAPAPARSKS